MGHMFGLGHSFGENVSPCISGNGEYCDAWDIMSAANVFLYNDNFQGVNGTFGPGLNAFDVKALGGLPPERLVSIDKPDFSSTIALAPLNQPLQREAAMRSRSPWQMAPRRVKADRPTRSSTGTRPDGTGVFLRTPSSSMK